MTAFPDDIEQKLHDGQRHRATLDLMARRAITLEQAHNLVGCWLFERKTAGFTDPGSQDWKTWNATSRYGK